MGQTYSGRINPDITACRKVANMSPIQIKLMREKFVLMCDDDLSIDIKGFMNILGMKDINEARSIFKLFDIENSGHIDSYEFICAMALLGYSNLKAKAEVIFGLFDFDNSLILNKDELVVLFRCTICSLQAMCGKKNFPTIATIEGMVNDILEPYDMKAITQITLGEFQSLVSKDYKILKLLQDFKLLMSDDLKDNLDHSTQMIECDSDVEDQIMKDQGESDQACRDRIIKNRKAEVKPIKVEETGELKNFVPSGEIQDIGLELSHVYGYRGKDRRNNLRLTTNYDLASFTSKVAWVTNRKTNNQNLFLHHTHEISCIASHDIYLATGEIAPEPTIYVWDFRSCQVKARIKGTLFGGVAHLAYSNDGKRLVAVEASKNHTVVIYDIGSILSSKSGANQSTTTFFLSSFRGPESSIYDITFDRAGTTLVFGCRKEVYFACYLENNFELKGLNRGNQESVLCLTSLEVGVIGGGYFGNIFVFKDGVISNQYEGHKGPCTTLWPRAQGKGLLSGGFDGKIITWDHHFKKVEEISLQTDVKTILQSYKIKALCQDPSDESFIVGTKAGDVIEINQKSTKFLVKGHMGDLTGLDKVGVKEEAVTVGRSKELIVWDLNQRKEKKVINIDFEGSVVATSPDGLQMAVGFVNGYVQIIEAITATVIKKIKDRSAKITAIKYSKPLEKSDLVLLAVGGEDYSIYFYNASENYKYFGKSSGFYAPPMFIDFTEGGKVLQVTDQNYRYSLHDTDIRKPGDGNRKAGDTDKKNDHAAEYSGKINRYQNAIPIKLESWSTWTCPSGTAARGLFHDIRNVYNVSSVALSIEKKFLAVGMRNGDLRLYRFPIVEEYPFFTKFMAHSSPISKIIFVEPNHLVTIGEKDRAVIHWKYTFDSERLTSPLGKSNDKDLAYLKRLTKIYEPIKSCGFDSERNLERQDYTMHYKDELTFPTRQKEAPDTNLELKHIFGCKYEGITQFAKFESNNNAVYFTGNKGVVQSSNNESKHQTFFTAHKRDITCMNITKDRTLVATGENAPPNETANIFIWSPSTKEITSHFKTRGTGGVIKLAFSPEIVYLISISNDYCHTLDIFEIATNSFLNSIQTEEEPILDLAFRSDYDFVTITSSDLRFWELKGINLVSVKANWKGYIAQDKVIKDGEGKESNKEKETDKLTCCLIGFVQNIPVSGTQNGYIYTWQNNAFQKSTLAHRSKAVRVMSCSSNTLYTGGDDGIIKTWNYSGRLVFNMEYIVKDDIVKVKPYKILSLDFDSNFVLVGTNKGLIFKGNTNSSDIVVEAHASQGITAVAVHPTTALFLTAGDDQRLIQWDANNKSQNGVYDFKDTDETILALDWSSNGEIIAAGTDKGLVNVFDKSLIRKHTVELGDGRSDGPKVSCVKINPSSNSLAVGFSDATDIQIFKISDKDKSLQKVVNLVNEYKTLYMDWSVDGEYIVSCYDCYKTEIFNTNNATKVKYSHIKDRNFQTWTQPIGIFVKGVTIDPDNLRYSPVCRSSKDDSDSKSNENQFDFKNNRLFLASGDRYGQVKLFRYPSIREDSDCKCYQSHSQNLTNVKIFNNNSTVITVSDRDNSIVIYQTDFKKELKTDPLENLSKALEDKALFDENVLSLPSESMKCKKAWVNEEQENPDRKDVARYNVDDKSGEKGKLGKPWMASLTYPSGYLKPEVNSHLPPKLRITPEYVFGFRTKDSRGNLIYLDDNQIIYCSACFVIVHRIKENTQRFFTHHQTDVTCFSYLKYSNMVASADTGTPPNIYIWSPVSLNPIRHIEATELKGGISKIQFCSQESNLIAAVCTDPKRTIAVFDYVNSVQMYAVSGDSAPIFDLKWLNFSEFVTVGLNHIKFWKIENNQLSSTRGKFEAKIDKSESKLDPQCLLCCAINKSDVLVGTSRGRLLVWRQQSNPPVLYTPFKTETSSEKISSSETLQCIKVTDQK